MNRDIICIELDYGCIYDIKKTNFFSTGGLYLDNANLFIRFHNSGFKIVFLFQDRMIYHYQRNSKFFSPLQPKTYFLLIRYMLKYNLKVSF